MRSMLLSAYENAAALQKAHDRWQVVVVSGVRPLVKFLRVDDKSEKRTQKRAQGGRQDTHGGECKQRSRRRECALAYGRDVVLPVAVRDGPRLQVVSLKLDNDVTKHGCSPVAVVVRRPVKDSAPGIGREVSEHGGDGGDGGATTREATHQHAGCHGVRAVREHAVHRR